ncbi:hypothetical protein ACTS9K_08075 [Empedobacter sp. ULE_I145]
MKRLMIIIFSCVVLMGCQFSKTTPDNTVLANMNFNLDEKIKLQFTDSNENKHEMEEKLKGTNATVKIEVITLENNKGTNSTLKNLSVTLVKGVKAHEFHSEINPQINNNSKDSLKTYSTVKISYFTENMFRKRYENTMFIVSSNGVIKEMK